MKYLPSDKMILTSQRLTVISVETDRYLSAALLPGALIFLTLSTWRIGWTPSGLSLDRCASSQKPAVRGDAMLGDACVSLGSLLVYRALEQ